MKIKIDSEQLPNLGDIGTDLADKGITAKEICYRTGCSLPTAMKLINGEGHNRHPYDIAIRLLALHKEKVANGVF